MYLRLNVLESNDNIERSDYGGECMPKGCKACYQSSKEMFRLTSAPPAGQVTPDNVRKCCKCHMHTPGCHVARKNENNKGGMLHPSCNYPAGTVAQRGEG